MSVDIRLSKVDRVYSPGDVVSGAVVVASKGSMSHGGITLKVDGEVTMQISAKSVGIFEAFYQSIKPIQLVEYKIDVKKTGNLPDGVSELPFEFRLMHLPDQTLYESYHGVFVNVQYTIEVEVIRKWSKNLLKKLEFIVEVPTKEEVSHQKIPFKITPTSLENVKRQSVHKIPQFEIEGEISSGVCHINRPFSGELTVKSSDAVIRSIELQLVRVETCGCADGFAKEATEIQNLQIADGDPVRNVKIPIYMVFPRLFTCPTTASRTFKIEFEVNLVVMWQDGHLISENFPVRLIRTPEDANQTYTDALRHENN